MKYLLFFIAGLWLVPSPSYASTLDMSKAFQIAASVKLGTQVEEDHPYSIKMPENEKDYDCLNDEECGPNEMCGGNGKCVPICTMGTPACNGTELPYCLNLYEKGKPAEPHKYKCVECLKVSDCGQGYTCNTQDDYSCELCEDGVSGCNCPDGQVADGNGGCRAGGGTPGDCKWFDFDTGFFYKNANGTINISSDAKCWDVYGAKATVNVPSGKTYDFVNVRMWQGATVNGSFSTSELTAHLNYNSNAHTVTFNDEVTINAVNGKPGKIKWEKQVQLNFKKGVKGSYECYTEVCDGNYGPCHSETKVDCPWDSGDSEDWNDKQKTEQCRKICGDDPSWGKQRFVYDRPGAKWGGKEKVCTRYPLDCGYKCTYSWDIKYGTGPEQPYTCQTAMQTGNKEYCVLGGQQGADWCR